MSKILISLYLALVALLPKTPDEVPKKERFKSHSQNYLKSCQPAVGAECGLFKVDRHELVPINLVHTPTKSPPPFGISKPASLLKFGNGLSLLTHLVFCCLLDNNRKYGQTKIRVALIISVSLLAS